MPKLSARKGGKGVNYLRAIIFPPRHTAGVCLVVWLGYTNHLFEWCNGKRETKEATLEHTQVRCRVDDGGGGGGEGGLEIEDDHYMPKEGDE